MSAFVGCGHCGSTKVDGTQTDEGMLWQCPDCGRSKLVRPSCSVCGAKNQQHEGWCPQGEES